MSPAVLIRGMCAVKCTASLFAVRHSSHAKLRAVVAHEPGALRVHWGQQGQHFCAFVVEARM
eukprot:2440610-Pleurochrysis_carterae.AAC.8